MIHIFGVMDVGGAELRTLELQKILSSEGFEFVYVTLSGRSGDLTARIEAMGGRVCPMSLDWHFPWRFVHLLRSTRPAAIDSHVATFSGALCTLAWLGRVPVRIAHFHSDNDGHLNTRRRRLQRLLMRSLVRRFATSVVGVSPSAIGSGYRPDWERFDNCAVIPNGTDVDQLWAGSPEPLHERFGLGSDSLLLAHVGRPSVEKNRVRLPAILRAVVDLGADAHLVLIGPADAADDALVLEAARVHGVEDRVNLVGPTQEIGRHLRGVDVLIQPSLREGLPGVVVEASAVGTPVVSSDVAGSVWLADRLEGIRCVSLDASDETWAATVLDVAAVPPARAAAREVAGASAMAVEASASAHRRLYIGSSSSSADASWHSLHSQAAVAVTTEAHFRRGPDGVIRTEATNSAYAAWCTYREVAAEILVVARVSDTESCDGHPVEGPRVRVVPIPGYAGLWGTIGSVATTYRALRGIAVRPRTAFVVRLPSIVGSVLIFALSRSRRPFAVEAIGDPFDVLRSGIVPLCLGGPASHVFKRLMQWQCARAIVINYVTGQTLQERYPAPRAIAVTAASDVRLADELVLHELPHRPLASPPVVVTVGTLTQPYKGHDVLVEAVAALEEVGVPVELWIVGSGKLRGRLEALAAARGVAARTIFVGQLDRDGVIAALDGADLFVLPSRTEGLPRALIEAMARGLPAVASAVGGVPELLAAEDLVPPGDPHELALAIRRLLEDPARRERARSRNLVRSRDFVTSAAHADWKSYFQHVRELIEG